ncbi:MAG: macrocin O-methyltransferase, partial [Chitinophagaceae bacterium]
LDKQKKWPSDFETFHKAVVAKVEPFTMTSQERIFGLVEAVDYIEKFQIEGDIVECGVWKGGSMLAIAETLSRYKNYNRKLYLYDTFEGMSAPTDEDVSHDNLKAEKLLASDANKNENLVWAYSTLEQVKKTMSLSSYPEGQIEYVKGKVEETIPQTLPGQIALLRLDTDWYESTKHELIHLFPKLVQGGVLIIDDYGYWKGARKAVDEYFKENKIRILLNRMDETGRIAVKQ